MVPLSNGAQASPAFVSTVTHRARDLPTSSCLSPPCPSPSTNRTSEPGQWPSRRPHSSSTSKVPLPRTRRRTSWRGTWTHSIPSLSRSFMVQQLACRSGSMNTVVLCESHRYPSAPLLRRHDLLSSPCAPHPHSARIPSSACRPSRRLRLMGGRKKMGV